MNNSKSWLVVRIKPNQDNIALKNLERQSFESFQPTYIISTRKHNKFKEVTKPVFPGYLFVAIDVAETNWHKINNTRGVSNIIVFGSKIPLISCELIRELKHHFSLDNISKPVEQFKVGTNAKITNGPFAKLAFCFRCT